MSRLVSFRIAARCVKPSVLVAWSGSIVSSYVRSIVRKIHEVRLVSVSPLFVYSSSDEMKVVLSGLLHSRPYVINEGSRVVFSFTMLCLNDEIVNDVILNLVNLINEDLPSYGFTVEQLDMYLVEREDLKPQKIGGDNKTRYMVTVEFCPTIFVFRGWRVLYPSPTRLVFSLAKSMSQLFPVDATKVKKRARVLTRYIEILNQYVKVVELNIGRGRVVKAFLGRVTYGVYGRDNLSDIIALIRLGELVNVGKSRGIGFGHIKLLDVKVAG